MKKLLPAFLILFALQITMAQTARVQIIHNSADAAAAEVDVYLDDVLTLDNVAFRTATAYIDFPADVEVEIAIAPGNSTSSNDAVGVFPVTLADGETYVVVADGIVSPTGYDPAPAFGLAVYGMGREAATVGTNTDVLVHHGSTDAPAVDVVESGVGAGTIVDDLAYTDFQGYLELPTDDYVLQIRLADGSTPSVAAYEAPLSTLSLDGAAIVVVASGFLDPSNNSGGAAFGLWVALPSGGALVELPSAALGTNDFALSQLVMYPNPATNNLTISSMDNTEYEVSIVDIQGRILQTTTLDSSETNINVSSLSTGMYQIVFSNDSKIVGSKKLIKQ